MTSAPGSGSEIIMSTVTHAPRNSVPFDRSTRTPGGSGRGPIGRIIAGSMVAGLLGALVLTLLVFTGAGEHVITGSALIAFGFGWAMLAVLSTRLTSRPQRWAMVPAGMMMLTGLGLLMFAPGYAALTAAGWVWPPALLVLAVWIGVQVRRGLAGRARWLLYPVAGVLAIGAGGGMYESVALARDHRSNVMPGASFDVSGRRLHLNCTGSGSPTVMLQGGLGETSPVWAHIAPAVARTTRVCAYDRAGQGWSGDAPRPQDGLQVVADLHELLDRAGERGPYVLVGHSTGGTYSMIYAKRYPADVAGMVLLDSASPDQFTVLPDYPAFYSMWRRVGALLPSLGRLGVGHLLFSSVGSTLPAPAAAQARAFATSPRDMRGQRDEFSTYPDVFTQAQALTLRTEPLVVVTATQGQQAGWSTAQDRLTALSGNTSHGHAGTTHAGLLDDQDAATISVRAINDALQSARTGSPLVTR